MSILVRKRDYDGPLKPGWYYGSARALEGPDDPIQPWKVIDRGGGRPEARPLWVVLPIGFGRCSDFDWYGPVPEIMAE